MPNVRQNVQIHRNRMVSRRVEPPRSFLRKALARFFGTQEAARIMATQPPRWEPSIESWVFRRWNRTVGVRRNGEIEA